MGLPLTKFQRCITHAGLRMIQSRRLQNPCLVGGSRCVEAIDDGGASRSYRTAKWMEESYLYRWVGFSWNVAAVGWRPHGLDVRALGKHAGTWEAEKSSGRESWQISAKSGVSFNDVKSNCTDQLTCLKTLQYYRLSSNLVIKTVAYSTERTLSHYRRLKVENMKNGLKSKQVLLVPGEWWPLLSHASPTHPQSRNNRTLPPPHLIKHAPTPKASIKLPNVLSLPFDSISSPPSYLRRVRSVIASIYDIHLIHLQF